jgi:histidinol-phosphate aminotransferase
VVLPPTYGMYQVSADINQVATRPVNLTPAFQMEPGAVLAATDARTKIIWLCSPNNPSGNLLQPADIEQVLRQFPGLVVVDEAYIDFSPQPSWVGRLAEFPNLVVLQTFSKAWGLAGLRLGMMFASAPLIAVINKIKPPYNINQLTQEQALAGLAQVAKKDEMVAQVLAQRDQFTPRLAAQPLVQTVYPTHANFWLVKLHRQAREMYEHLVAHQIVVRDRSKVPLCENCLRITVGTAPENERLLAALASFAG